MLTACRSYEEACRTFRWKIPERYNLAFDVCDRQTMAGADGHRTALIVEAADGGVERHTFHMLRLLSNRLANGLAAMGIAPGDRVAMALPAGLEAAVTLLAVTKMGAVLVPVPLSLGSEPLGWRLADSGARVAVVDPAALPALERARSRLPELERVLAVGGGGGALDLWSELERSSDAFTPLVTPADHPAFIFYPEAACGRPAGVIHAHRAMAGGLPAVEMSLTFFPQFGDIVWTSSEWMGAEALFRAVLPAWHHGVPVVACPGPFDPVQALDLMSRHGVRTAYVPPHHLGALTEAAASRPHAMPRAIASGPEPLDEDLHERVIKVFGVHANEAWGVLESGAVAANLAGLMELRPPSPGRAAPGLSIDAVDERGRPLRAGDRGLLAVSPNAPGSFLGYWGDGAGAARRVNGWLITGRSGFRDLDHYLWPDPPSLPEGAVLVGGCPVQPEEVELALAAHPDVVAAAVLEWTSGELKAFVVAGGRAADAAFTRELQAWVRLTRSPVEVPSRMEFVDELPLSMDGSVRRADLRDRPIRVDAPSPDERWPGKLR
ncbi:AMP-binding protein [Paramagnetospirillum magneticum]|uniref:Acyl-coenzyme A synthetase/AMP-(Fatty) acid ligase n=1 Tax=Paramagnetospirillum magneticum (strain ATCC 700264 / AMB-1) TaxID=342108 RepID=Q2W0K6_PARM1|nr:AMP-binding protein [Paramagnetospirillum magneticum]BAE52619.1 Acyl-coenzyme A synthetase/AMP-(fatty) acid ligase [Paramagnetospirillum magneticum AMB-1]